MTRSSTRTVSFRQFRDHTVSQIEAGGPSGQRFWEHCHEADDCGAVTTGVSEQQALDELTIHTCRSAA